jgi:hypothetical protein
MKCVFSHMIICAFQLKKTRPGGKDHPPGIIRDQNMVPAEKITLAHHH